jgi:CBS domain-containing protein
MKLEKVMKTNIETCRTFESVESAAGKMRARNIGFLPVCDDTGVVVGTLTDRDLAIRVLGERRNPDNTLVLDVMTPEVVFCTENEEVEDVERLMAESHVSRIVCVDADKHPIGVISLSDLAFEGHGKADTVLREISEREARPEEY